MHDRRTILLVFTCFGSLLFFGCGPNESILKSGSNNGQTTSASRPGPPATDTVETEVENMRTANFDHIIVLRRKDAGVMQADDKAFVRAATPSANRRSLVDNEKAIVIGSNAIVTAETLAELARRFEVRDLSGPAGGDQPH